MKLWMALVLAILCFLVGAGAGYSHGIEDTSVEVQKAHESEARAQQYESDCRTVLDQIDDYQ